MLVRLIIILILFSYIKSSIAQNSFWVKKDKILIHKFGKVYVNNPDKIPSLCKIDINKVESHRYENLGFGYKRLKGGKAGGYAGIKVEFYFYQDSLIGYTIFPNLPNKKKLRSKYQKWYQAAFNIKDEISPVYHNSKIMHEPLKAYSGNLNIEELDMDIRFYFSLQSGITYGYRGGASNSIIRNRATFIKLIDKLSGSELEFLMYSRNPATRLTAIEYYLRNKDLINLNSSVDKWIENVLLNTGLVRTLHGCFASYEDSRLLLEAMVNTEINPYIKDN